MMRQISRIAVLMAGIFVVGSAAPGPAAAQTLLQRLFPRLAARRALRQGGWTAYYPVTSSAQVIQPPVVVTYKPQVQYRTVWASVPVTQYRPVSWTDPATGYPVTAMRPCSTYSWQARRVAYTTYQPVYAAAPSRPGLLGCLAGTPGPAAVSYATPQQPAYAPSYSPSYAPGYASGAALAPASGACCGGAPPPAASTPPAIPYAPPAPPSSVIAPPTSPGSSMAPRAPAGSIPQSASPSTEPASQAPSLDRRSLPQAREGAPTDTEIPGNQNGDSGSGTGGAAADSPNSATSGQAGARDTPYRSLQSPAARSPSGRYLQPIPDPDRRPRTLGTNAVPQLIDPRDQTALRTPGHHWAAVPISWDQPVELSRRPAPEVLTSPVHTPRVGQMRTGQPPRLPWDDTGWRHVPH